MKTWTLGRAEPNPEYERDQDRLVPGEDAFVACVNFEEQASKMRFVERVSLMQDRRINDE